MMIPKQLGVLGLTVKDKITGLEGVAVSIWFDLYGCARAVVQPKTNAKGELPHPRSVDYNRLVFLGTNPVFTPPEFSVDPNALPAQLGDLGRFGEDQVTGFKGICSSVGFFLQGCVIVTITPAADLAEGKIPEAENFDHHRAKFSGLPVMEVPDYAEDPVSPPKVLEKPHGSNVIELAKPA